MQRKIIETGDGSKTIHYEEWDESYHSTSGGVEEAEHVYVNQVRVRIGDRKEISILEMGFGTGLNAFLTLRLAKELNIKVNYVGIEAYPVTKEESEALNYTSLWEDGKKAFDQMQAAKWGEKTEVHPDFSVTKIEAKFEDWEPIKDTFDFIFFDAFGPIVQPKLWTIPIFQKMYDSAKNGAFILTYCAKGQVRRDLGSVGFAMERIPGPPAKRHMLVGEK